MVCANSSFATSIDFGSLSDNHGTRASHVCATAVRKRIPRGARIIDAEGNVLITGLWDRYSHSLGRWNGRPCQCVRWRDPVGYLAKRDRQSGPIPRTRCRLETISSCKLADLMLLEANPLREHRPHKRIGMVVLNGRSLAGGAERVTRSRCGDRGTAASFKYAYQIQIVNPQRQCRLCFVLRAVATLTLCIESK